MEFNYVRLKDALAFNKPDMSGFMATSAPVLTFLKVKNWLRDVRDELAEFSRLKKMGYAEKLRTVTNAHHDMITTNFPLYQRTDGVTGSSYLRFAVAEDTREGKTKGQRSIYFATDSESLATKENELGHREFESTQGVYLAATMPAGSSPTQIRNEIERHVMDFSDFGVNSMTVSGGDLSSLHVSKDSIGRSRTPKVYGYTNDQFCITVRQNPAKNGGGWTLKLSKPFSDSDDKAYTTYDNINPQMTWLKALLSNGAVYDTFETREEALAHMDMFQNAALQLIWQHKEPVNIKSSPSKTLVRAMTFATSSVSKFFSKEFNFENVKEAIFDAGWTLGAAVIARTALAGVMTMSLPLTIASVIGFNYLVRKFKGVTFEAMDQAKLFLNGPKGFFGIAGDYVDPKLANMRRDINPKPHKEIMPHMHILNGEELDLTYSNDGQRNPDRDEKISRKRIAQPVSALSKKFHPIDRYTSTTVIFNGLSCLNHWDPVKKVHTSYYKLTGATNLNEHIQMRDKDRRALEAGKIVKHVHTKGGKKVSEEYVAPSRMKRDLESRLFKIHDEELDIAVTDKRRKQAFDHIAWLFNNKNASANDNGIASETEPSFEEIKEDEAIVAFQKPTNGARTMEALKMAFGDRAVKIAEPAQDLIQFYRGCVLPDTSWVAATP